MGCEHKYVIVLHIKSNTSAAQGISEGYREKLVIKYNKNLIDVVDTRSMVCHEYAKY